ncbi:peptidase m20 [Coleophoma cylindrospora]|uniref:Peptidase m20 n=1 Tax=Coleophoma cylindrospora TaxID=1849047 RepID=A0A3D8RHU4_9HELO|nr:peptidase m20 [Coleophoma cylindrospora]
MSPYESTRVRFGKVPTLSTLDVDDDFVLVDSGAWKAATRELPDPIVMLQAGVDEVSRVINREASRTEDFLVAARSTTDVKYQAFIGKYMNSISPELRRISLIVHDNPELNYEEFIAHKALTDFMKKQKGWKVTPSAYGIPTAFIAEYDSGKPGPVRDALRGIGHSCGHNLIAICSTGASLAVASAMKDLGVPGKVILFGTPAEEGGGGKIKLLDAGAYSDHKVDINLISHPGTVDDSVLVRTTAYHNFKVEYFGKEAHAAAAPWEGVNALDAMITGYNALSVLRQQTMPGDIIQGHITNGGSAPNIIHAYTSGIFVVRALSKARLAQLRKKVEACFEAGASATGAKLKITSIISYDDHVPNKALGLVCREAANNLDGKIPEPDIDLINGQSGASTDQGNISYAMPSLSYGFAIKSEAGPHNPGFAAAARTMQAHGRALRAGEILAYTGIQALIDEKLLKDAKDEFAEMVQKL